jgi:hypothetical protein
MHMEARFWIGVASAAHVQRAVAGGFAQLCHGAGADARPATPGPEALLSGGKAAPQGRARRRQVYREAPLRRLRTGDWLVYYSPRTEMGGGEPLQMFTAIGKVVGDSVYPHRMTPDFVPFRRDVAYRRSQPAAARPLLPKLSFVKDPRRWGSAFRRGHLEVTRRDFEVIARAMGVHVDA